MLNDDFSPEAQDVQQAAQARLARLKQANEQSKERVGDVVGPATGIIGALLGGFLGESPQAAMAGYNAGSQLGKGASDLATGAKRKTDPAGGIPGMQQLQTIFGQKKPAQVQQPGAMPPVGLPQAPGTPPLAADYFK